MEKRIRDLEDSIANFIKKYRHEESMTDHRIALRIIQCLEDRGFMSHTCPNCGRHSNEKYFPFCCGLCQLDGEK